MTWNAIIDSMCNRQKQVLIKLWAISNDVKLQGTCITITSRKIF